MRHLLYGRKDLLVDDEVAECLVVYAAAVARSGGSDSVTIRALGTDGNEVEATMVLNASSQLITETAHTRAVAPPDPEIVAYLRVHTHLLENPPSAQPEPQPPYEDDVP